MMPSSRALEAAPSFETARLRSTRSPCATGRRRPPPPRRHIAVLFLALAALLACGRGVAGADRPNVVLVMTDDQGYGDLGFTGNPVIRTPNLDAMARRSARLTNFYVSPVCAPTRASLMTGRYNYRTRVIDTWLGRAMMDPSEVTVAEILRGAGYATGVFGKWHLGDNYPMRPQDQGFDVSLVHRGGGIGQPGDPPGGEGKYTDPVLFRNGVREETEGYCTDVYFREALAFMTRAHAAGRPFFVYLPTNAPHAPFGDVPEKEYHYYRSRDLSNARFPQARGHPLPERCDQDKRARIYAMITNIDTNVGRLFDRLRELAIERDTLVMFLVDNGPNSRRYVGGFRGSKTTVYEGGVRSPFFAHWPARLKAGTTADVPAAHYDLLPTILEACAVKLPAGLRIDGRSVLAWLEGKRDVAWPERTIYIQAHRGDVPVRYHQFLARGPRWKLLHASGFGRESFDGPPRFELYDLGADPFELHDVAAEHPEVVAEMKRGYDRWFDDVGATRPDNYAPPRIRIGTPHENPVTLTRQDWRHRAGRPWGADSIGRWLLRADSPGPYEVVCRFAPRGAPEVLRLEVSGRVWTADVPAGRDEARVASVRLPAGDLWLEATLRADSRARGVHQVDVRWRPETAER